MCFECAGNGAVWAAVNCRDGAGEGGVAAY